MKRILCLAATTLALTLAATSARAVPVDDECTDASCQIDPSIDECAAPGAGCLPERELSDDELERAELALPVGELAAADVGAATAAATASTGGVVTRPDDGSGAHGGCSLAATDTLPSAVALLAILFVVSRRRRALPLLILATLLGCVGGGDAGWDDALADGPPASATGQFLDVLAADRIDGHGSAFVLDGEDPAAPSAEPAAAFSLSRHALDGARAIRRAADAACGDRLVASDAAADGELLGYAAAAPAAGTAALTELVAPDGCGALYETDAEAIALFVADGWSPGAVVGYVWPPGWGDADPVDDSAGIDVASETLTPCALGKHPALFLLYTGIDRASDATLLRGCPGEVVLGEKHMDHPRGAFAGAAAHAAGGRSALVFGGNGSQFRDLLLRSNGVERTAAFIRQRLAAGYDYVVVDEVTTDASWRDGSTVNRRFRQLLTRIPPRTLIPYISLDLTMYPGGGQALRERRLLLRAFKLRGRALALEEYLHTDAVVGGAAPRTFRSAADRVAAAVHGMRGIAGISGHEITTIGLSMHTRYPQYNYLDDTGHDRGAVSREAIAVRHSGSRTRAQHGLGFYFVGKSDITPAHGYTLSELDATMHKAMLRFR